MQIVQYMSLETATEMVDHNIYGSTPFPDRPIGFSPQQIRHVGELFGERMALVFIAQGSVNELRKTVEPYKSSNLSMYEDAGYMRSMGDMGAWHLVGVCSLGEYREKKDTFDVLSVKLLELREVTSTHKAMQGTCPEFFGKAPVLTGSAEVRAMGHLSTTLPSVLVQLCAQQIRIETALMQDVPLDRLVALGVRESFHTTL